MEIPELEKLGWYIRKARQSSELNQAELARRCSLTQAQISYFESGRRRPTLDQFLRIAKALDVPVQWLLSGSDRPGARSTEIAIELRHFGIGDLWVSGAVVPGACRRPEELVSIVLSAREPDPRIVEAIPAVLAWNKIHAALLRAHGTMTKTLTRIGWLADIALTIERQGGFPGGCQKGPLEQFLKKFPNGSMNPLGWDDLGKPTPGPPASPIWKRWSINYDASLEQFEQRARLLNDLRAGARGKKLRRTASVAREPGKEDGPGRP